MKKVFATLALVAGLCFGNGAMADEVSPSTVEMIRNVIEVQDSVIATQQELMESQRILLETVSKVVEKEVK